MTAGGWNDPAKLGEFARRLWARDDTLWGEAARGVAAKRLGWLDLAQRMPQHVPELEALAGEAAAEGFTHAVLLGMGGSSLAPEVMRLIFGVRPGRLDLAVLDNTSPAAVRAVAGAHDPTRTLFVVSSKSGTTIEVACFEQYFWKWVADARPDPGRAFVAITDPGTPLEALARSRGYRRAFLNPPDIGGRYSALSLFGLVPAALIGVDLAALLTSAGLEAVRSGPQTPEAAGGVKLGAELGSWAAAGRDKLTLVPGPGLEPLGSWLEQLVAESTGKDGRGLVPVDSEPLAAPSAYGEDRVFVELLPGAMGPELPPGLQALRDAGHPVLREPLDGLAGLGGAFLRWEVATATAGAVLGVNPFDEPDVAAAKHATDEVLRRFLDEGRFPEPAPQAGSGGLAASAPDPIARALRARAGDDAAAWAGALLTLAKPGDYFAVLAYLHRTPEVHERLTRLRLAARRFTRLATTLGYGPRFQHSTGQLHKGGPDTGLFLQIVGEEGPELPIPGERFGFGALRRAQALGDYQVLVARGRRVVRVDLGAAIERGLDGLVDALALTLRS